jgi:hypothetical protein
VWHNKNKTKNPSSSANEYAPCEGFNFQPLVGNSDVIILVKNILRGTLNNILSLNNTSLNSSVIKFGD